MKFDLPKEFASIIKVIGVGGGGGNAVNHMHEKGIKGVDFIVCNTDSQALESSPVPVKIQIGVGLTEGLGAGSIPDRGRLAMQENIDEISDILKSRTKMVFITAGMGGGTGTGAAPVIAEIARGMGILTVGIVTSPFQWEGRKRRQQAVAGIEEMRRAVDTLLVINNDRLRELYGDLSLDNAFEHADNVLSTAARGIAEIINKIGKVNVDFEDVKTVMTDSGVSIMGMAEAEGEDRALRAAHEALASPLLNDSDIKGAKFVLLNVTHGERALSMDEMTEITDHIQEAAGSTADVIWGYGKDDSLGDSIRITLIATGFAANGEPLGAEGSSERKVMDLGADLPTMITQPIANPVSGPVAEHHKASAEPATPTEPFLKSMEPVAERTPAPFLTPQHKLEFGTEKAAQNATPMKAEKPAAEEKKVFDLYDAGTTEAGSGTQRGEVNEAKLSPEEHTSRVEDRQSRIREFSTRLRTPSGLSELEREPAYKRKNLHLNNAQPSMDSNISRYTLNEETDENGERRVELKRNNPYLHDNVD